MDEQLRKYFDQHLDKVMADMPEQIHRLLDEVPLYVEDFPSAQVMRQTGVSNPRQLCGLYTGVPIGRRSVEMSGVLSDVIHIYRQGILDMAADRHGRIDPDELVRQIRITVLHELGHHHGLGEEDLRRLGY